ncbi:MAG TPA: glycosyltransferase family 39 protein [Pseudolysinimonas sp.]|nr:glycosyltransferase family 39 protein [Pseudolysinimonas sp.]
MLPALAGILIVACALYAWRLGASGFSTYYASSAKSMADNWRAFAFGSLDPASTWTLDKLSGFLVPQAIAVRLFGFHAWALDLPQVIEGLVTIVTSYVIGARWRGAPFGIGVAAIMATTPLLAAMFGHPTEDAMLTMAMALAFAAWQRAILSGHVAWMLLAAFWVAVGFQAKMLQAWLIVPALLIGFVAGSGGTRSGRLGKAVLAGFAAAVLSLAWTGAIQSVPTSARPYVDGTTNNNAFSMVFAYNGTDRIVPGLIPGGVPQLPSHLVPGRGTATAATGHLLLKMVVPGFATQIGWLYPAAALGCVLLILMAAGRRRVGTRGPPGSDATILTLLLWLGVSAGVLSVAFVPHATYFGIVALPLALLAAVGIAESVARYRTRARSWLLPALVAAQALWAASIAILGSASTAWLSAPILVAGVAGVLSLIVAARGGTSASLGARKHAAVALAVLAIVLAPMIWSSFVFGPGGAGSAGDAYAGPRDEATRRPAAASSFAAAADAAAERRLLDYVAAHGAGSVRFATDTLAIAVAVNLDTGEEVIPLGGFSRQAPWFTPTALATAVASGEIRFVLLSRPSASDPPNPVLDETRSWTRSRCAPVLQGSFRARSRDVQTLYDCAAATGTKR